ncbi:MAG: LysR family transcriptional regulator [Rhizobiales bacterium]|nr:LysR family transcriptional regulator [Hyphomicrobiales bacterium]MBA68337.1 LysR family transcriptional regulator [Hyphomicrobiales bacterium]|tara:strand:- start:1732 stop:2688 length:957 start_codon:yes stop_codon:yes gene_type:complete
MRLKRTEPGMSLNSLQLRHIRSFLAVAERKSFVDAAGDLGVSQPALSQTINHFEQVLGLKLFERTTRHVELTEHGVRLLRKSGDLDAELKSYFRELQLLRDSVGARIRIGYLIGTGVQFMPEAIRQFEEAYPAAEVELLEYDFNRPDAGLRNGEVDCAIVRPPLGIDDVEFEFLMTEKCIVCLPDGHPLCAHDVLTLSQIKDYSFVAAPGAGVWRDYWLAGEHMAGEVPKVVHEAATLDSELQAVATRKGISITAESTASYYARPGVTFRPLGDMKDCEIAVGFRAGGSPRVQEFVKIVRQVARAIADGKMKAPAARL